MNLRHKTYEDSAAQLSDPDVLKIKAEQDGYLYLRSVLDPEPLLQLRREVLEILDDSGFLRTGVDFMDGRLATDCNTDFEEFCGTGVSAEVYREIQRLELWHRMPHSDRLMALLKILAGPDVFIHPGLIGRIIIPRPDYSAIPPHQDYLHVHGSQRTWTCWMPLGDVPKELGGLSILRGSHHKGVYPVYPKAIGGYESIVTEEGDCVWLTGDFELGDILIFHCLTVHRATQHQQSNQIRLSMDFRFQPLADQVSPTVLKPHGGILEWDEVYKNWKDSTLQYYFKRQILNLAEKDPC